MHEELSEQAYNERLQILRHKLEELSIRVLTDEEMHSIIYRGAFIYNGYRYEYDANTGRYEQVAITDGEYTERLHQLQDQLQSIGYEHMSLFECNTTIYTGSFFFNGYDWFYNYDTNVYDRSNVERTTQIIPEYRPDETQYSRVTTEPAPIPTDEPLPRPESSSVTSTNRGDQPPQTFVDDYEQEEEVVEQEPGVGYYPVPTELPIPTTRVLQSGDDATDGHNAELAQQRGEEEKRLREEEEHHREEEERIRVYEEQRRAHEEGVRALEAQRAADEENQRVHEAERRLHEEQLQRAQEEQRRAQEEQRIRDEQLQQETERQVAEQLREEEERRRSDELRREDELKLREEQNRRQEEVDRRARERREEEERQQTEDDEEQGGDDEGGDEDDQENEDEDYVQGDEE